MLLKAHAIELAISSNTSLLAILDPTYYMETRCNHEHQCYSGACCCMWRPGVKQQFPQNLAICRRVEALVYIKVLPVGKSQTKYHISPYMY